MITFTSALLHAFLTAILISCTVPLAKAQQGAEPAPTSSPEATFRSNVRVVLVDVVVTNGKGESVGGLTKEAFQVQEQGKLQNIVSFQELTGAPAAKVNQPPIQPNVFTNHSATAPGNAVTILLLDALNTPLENQLFMHQEIVRYLRSVNPESPVAIFKLARTLRIVQGFTTDTSALLEAVNDRKMGSWPETSSLLRTHNDWELEARQNGQMTSPEIRAAPASAAAVRQNQTDAAAFMLDVRVKTTLEELQQLARYLSAVPGRKNLIWLSRSFPTTIFSNPKLGSVSVASDYSAELRKTANLLTLAQVAVYPIGAEGLRVSDESDSVSDPALSNGVANPMLADILADDVNHLTMDAMAEETGGRAAYNTNGVAEALNHAIQHGTHYYTLSYTPSNKKMDGTFRHIQIKLAAGDYKLDYRRGYFADDTGKMRPAESKSVSDPLKPAMARGLPNFAQIQYTARVVLSNHQPSSNTDRVGDNPNLKSTVKRFSVGLRIPANDLALRPAPDGSQHGSLEVALGAYDHEGNPLNWMVRTIEVTLPPDPQKAMSEASIPVALEIDVPDGDTYLRSGLYDPASNKTGTIEIPLSAIAAHVAQN